MESLSEFWWATFKGHRFEHSVILLLPTLVSGSPAGSLGPTYIADHPRQMPGIDVMPRPDHGVTHDALDGSLRRLVPRRLFHRKRARGLVPACHLGHRPVSSWLTNLSPKTTANWVLASNHSRGGRFHSSAAWIRTRYGSLIPSETPNSSASLPTRRSNATTTMTTIMARNLH